MWFSGGFWIHNPTELRPARIVPALFIQTSVVPKEHPGRDRSAGTHTSQSPPCLPLPQFSLAISARHRPFIHPPPAQSVLPLWLVLCLCRGSVPTFKSNNSCCIPPLWTNARTKNRVRSNCVCADSYCAAPSFSRPVCQSLTCPKCYLSSVWMCDNQNTSMIKTNTWKVVSKSSGSSCAIFPLCSSCNLGTASV